MSPRRSVRIQDRSRVESSPLSSVPSNLDSPRRMPSFPFPPPASFATPTADPPASLDPGPTSDPVVVLAPSTPGPSVSVPVVPLASPSPRALSKSGLPHREVAGFYEAVMVSMLNFPRLMLFRRHMTRIRVLRGSRARCGVSAASEHIFCMSRRGSSVLADDLLESRDFVVA